MALNMRSTSRSGIGVLPVVGGAEVARLADVRTRVGRVGRFALAIAEAVIGGEGTGVHVGHGLNKGLNGGNGHDGILWDLPDLRSEAFLSEGGKVLI